MVNTKLISDTNLCHVTNLIYIYIFNTRQHNLLVFVLMRPMTMPIIKYTYYVLTIAVIMATHFQYSLDGWWFSRHWISLYVFQILWDHAQPEELGLQKLAYWNRLATLGTYRLINIELHIMYIILIIICKRMSFHSYAVAPSLIFNRIVIFHIVISLSIWIFFIIQCISWLIIISIFS